MGTDTRSHNLIIYRSISFRSSNPTVRMFPLLSGCSPDRQDVPACGRSVGFAARHPVGWRLACPRIRRPRISAFAMRKSGWITLLFVAVSSAIPYDHKPKARFQNGSGPVFLQKIIGRTAEKAELRKIYASDRPELVVVYGRRRVGKTFLIREFFEGQFASTLFDSFSWVFLL